MHALQLVIWTFMLTLYFSVSIHATKLNGQLQLKLSLRKSTRVVMRYPTGAAIVALCGAWLCTSAVISPADAVSSKMDGAKLFDSSCSGCHSYGSNILNGGKTLKKASLIKNKMFDEASIEEIISQGKGQMSPYGPFISPIGNAMPSKLTSEEISAIASYVLQQAEVDWPKHESNKNCDEYPGC